MIPFNFHHLYYFYTVAELGSVSKAAEKIHISQPALSAQINQFEKYLKVDLFEREGKRLILTAEGRSALEYAHTIFDTGKEFIDNFQDRAQKGRLRIQLGISNSIAKTFAVKITQFIWKVNPEAHIIIHKDTTLRMVEKLDNHQLDIILSDVPVQTSIEEGIFSNLIGKIPIVFCAHPKLAAKYKIFPKQLNDAPMILPTAHSQIYHSVLEYFASHKISPKIIAEIQDVELIHRMVLEGVGIAPLNRFDALNAPFKNKLIILDEKSKHEIHDSLYVIVKRRQNPHPLTEKIIKEFKTTGLDSLLGMERPNAGR